LSTSGLTELEQGSFQVAVGEIDAHDDKLIDRVVLCSGKVYFDLLEERRKRELHNVAIIRVEQLYPFPRDQVSAYLTQYKNVHEVIWCQEEPRNQGPWYQIQHHLRACIRRDQGLVYAGRPPSPAPAPGYYAIHLESQRKLIDDALSPFVEDEDTLSERRHVS
jgi:2-oxoglutarate dehydrogenase E1 component